MTVYIQVDDPAVLIFDTESPDDTQTHYSLGTLREFASQMQSAGAAKLRTALLYKARTRPITKNIIDCTLIDARTK